MKLYIIKTKLNLTQPPSSEEVDEVLKELDENGDGKLSLDEFQVLIE
jgi:calmodulin